MTRKLVTIVTAISVWMSAFAAPALAASPRPPADTAIVYKTKTTTTTKTTKTKPDAAAQLEKLVQGFRTKLTKGQRFYDDIGFSDNHYDYTAEDVKMLAIVISLEAGNEPYAAKLAVGNVVMNRVLSPGYPGDTVAAVVTQPNQFSYNPAKKPNAQSKKAALEILKNEAWAVPQNTYFFRATSSKENWGGHAFTTILGHTAFYTDSYSGRSNTKEIPAKLHERVFEWPQYGCQHSGNVRKIQLMLKALGYKGATDGYFGQGTRDALMKFQTDRDIKADGIAGPATLRALISKYGVAKFQKLK